MIHSSIHIEGSMEKKLKSLVGQYCKLVIKESESSASEVMTGVIDKISYKDGFVYVSTPQGPACFRIDIIIAAKKIKKVKIE